MDKRGRNRFLDFPYFESKIWGVEEGRQPLFPKLFPLPLIKGKRDKGGWGYQIKSKAS